MLSRARTEIGPIDSLLTEFDPDADTNRMGSWGMLYLVCGASASHSRGWLATIIEPSIGDVYRQFLSGTVPETVLAYRFKSILLDWMRDSVGLKYARECLEDLKRTIQFPPHKEADEAFISYFRLAIMLNTFTDWESDDIAPIRHWAAEHDRGWPTLFYAAGVLLRDDSRFSFERVKAGLLFASHSAKPKVKVLLEQFGKIR